MVKIIDGPAMGAKLNLQRTPKYLRVVIDLNKKVDALDLKTDTPMYGERLYAYIMIPESYKRGFYCGENNGCQLLNFADYKICQMQPDQKTMSELKLWENWVENRESVTNV